MGKKSRKKGGGNSTRAARKEKLLGRREPRLEDEQESNSEYKRPYFCGDRVFHDDTSWGHPDNPHAYRGIVCSIRDNSLMIKPLSKPPSDHAKTIIKSPNWVLPDFCNMTLRFSVGDRVVYSTRDDGWVAGTVGLCWPVCGGNGYFPACPEDTVPRYAIGPDLMDLVLHDDDDFIVKHPTSFRFSVGDSVVLDARVAIGTGKSSSYLRTSSWLEGNVTSVDITGLFGAYAVYACSFTVAGKQHGCHVIRDDDEHVARSDANPRDRLFDAIEQDCSFYHLNYLSTHFKIDVATFRDILVDKAIHFGSYRALAWLQHNCNIDVTHIRDNLGNTLLHKLASSPHAIRFIKEAGRVSCLPESPDWALDLIDYEPITRVEPMTSSLNASGETWLHILVRRNDIKALDAALSPHNGLAWDFSGQVYLRSERVDSLALAIKDAESATMQCIFDAFVSFRQLNQQCTAILYQTRQPAELFFDFFKEGEDAGHHAKKLVRFYRDWRHHSSRKLATNPFTSLVLQGYFDLFSLLCDVDDSLFLNATYHVTPDKDQNEYLQSELRALSNNDDSHDREVDIFMACVIGQHESCHATSYRHDYHRQKREYFEYLRRYAVRCRKRLSGHRSCVPSLADEKVRNETAAGESRKAADAQATRQHNAKKLREHQAAADRAVEVDGAIAIQQWIRGVWACQRARSCDSLLSYLKAIHCSNGSDDGNTFCKARISLLEDDANLGGRLEILNYLLEKEKKIKPNILEVIRNRRCGFLRFLEDKGLVQLRTKASSNRLFLKYTSKFGFLERGRIPPSMTTACFLCFVAVEYDDLQSLQWICERHGVPTESVDGFNLLHLSGFLGRFEIIVWLSTQPCWHALLMEGSNRKPFQNAFAIHIALFEGHTTLTETMIALQVSTDDAQGKPLHFWGKKSRHEWVRQWTAKREKPSILERNIARLLHLLNTTDITFQKLKKFIITSKCLEVETWDDCGYFEFDAKAAMGYSLGDVLHECCNRFPHNDFVFWLCFKSYFYDNECIDIDGFWGGSRARQKHLIQTLNRDELLAFAEAERHDDLVGYLSKGCLKDISCVDPVTCNFLLKSVLPSKSALLLEIRAKILRLLVFIEIANESNKAFNHLIQHGGCPNELDDILAIKSYVKKVLNEEGYAESSYKHCVYINDDRYHFYTICELLRPLNMSSICGYKGQNEHQLSKQLAIKLDPQKFNFLSQVHLVLAREGNAELLKYCLRNLQGWTVDMEYILARSAAFLGHLAIVDIFLCPRDDLTLLSEKNAACVQVMLGFGEACLCRDLRRLVEMCGPPNDPVKDGNFLDEDEDEDESGEIERKHRRSLMNRSLLCAVLHGYFAKTFNDDIDNRKDLRTLRLLVDKLNYTHEQILIVMGLFVPLNCDEKMCDFVDFFESVIHGLCLQPFMHNEQMQTICNKIVESCQFMSHPPKRSASDRPIDRIFNWLNEMAGLGVDLQKVLPHRHYDEEFMEQHQKLQKRQKQAWSQFDAVKNGQRLEEIQDSIKCGVLVVTDRDRGGLMLTHLSSAYNRVDLLEWLVTTKGMDINAVEGQGRTALDVAKAAQASLTTRWIMEWQAKRAIVRFVKRNYQRLLSARQAKRMINAATLIQRYHRGYLARKVYSGVLSHQVKDSQRFSAIWGHLIKSCQHSPLAKNWSSIRDQFSSIRRAALHDETYCEDTDEQLTKALKSTMKEDKQDDTSHQIETKMLPTSDKILSVSNGNIPSEASWLTFQLTSHIVKFLKQGDPKYKVFFVRRMQQLANGERSRILQKRLKGSQSTIWETYLEQKSGFRILWTEEMNGKGRRSIVVWFVAKHKQVSRLMKLIDDAKSRTARQQLSQSLISDLQNDNLVPPSQREGVLLDVFGNVPLKLYDVNYHNIKDITKKSWTPKLHLTDEERDVVEAKGTVLVLGRSGTGKTVCICNRIEHDRQQYGQNDSTFSQLFVARSKRLCRYVAEAVGLQDKNTFLTFEELMCELHAALPYLDEDKRIFIPSQKIDFQRFKQEFHNAHAPKEKKISALIAWTVIRTFIKGSIEAFQNPSGILPKESFVAVEVLGKNRCRVPANLREYIYEEFIKYEQYKSGLELWDDCDRTRHLLKKLHKSRQEGSAVFDQVRRSKIYVDEIQDYSQIECLIFFYLGGPGGLFLAGDPAQSVVEGTSFRFDEIRSLGHFVAGSERRDLIPQKPKSVNVNFRSHAGILNTAAAFLHLLFKYFPGSAKQLKKDHGLFQGSRPGVLHKVNVQHLADLVSDKLKGIVILSHDESVHHWRQILGNYPYCYGIREAKGLEFKSVMILNFFQDLPSSLHKPWRNLLLNREGLDFETKHPLVETQLKLLYTGITRCIERLFIVETQTSVAGDAVVRWLTTSSVNKFEPTSQRNDGQALATRNNINDIEAMSMTADEFVAEGFNNAEVAESAELDLDQACIFLDRAIWCFEQASNSELATKSRTHRQSVLFRIDLTQPPDSKSATEKTMIEMKGAKVMESLAKEGLVFEMVNVLYSIRPFLELAHYNRLHHWMMLFKASSPK